MQSKLYDENDQCFTYKYHVEGNQLQNQRSCGEKKANGEDIRKGYLAVEYQY